MNIGIVGLGLIGGSVAKALRQKNAGYRLIGADRDADVPARAMEEGAIDDARGIERCDVVFVCLYPRDAVSYILNQSFKQGAVVTDMCGVKGFLSRSVSQRLNEAGVRYVGSHPMAGREQSGFAASGADLFRGASYIIARDAYTDEDAVDLLTRLAAEMGFSRVTLTTPEEHDRVIAYTSQLAHVVSNSYIKNPEAERKGFSAGSFEDLTRVAKLNPAMWAELFMENADALCADVDVLIGHMNEIKRAIRSGEEPLLRELLRRGSDVKERLLRENGAADSE